MSDTLIFEEPTEHLRIKFYTSDVKQEGASKEAGRPIHKSVDMVEIRFPGDNKTVIQAFADDKSRMVPGYGYVSYKQRFPRHWEAYERTKVNLVDGTPLDELTSIESAKRADLKAINIHTVEALATLSDTNMKKLGMDGRVLRETAQAYLDKAAGNAVESRLIEENAEMKTTMSALEAELARLKSQVEMPEKKTLSIPSKDKAA
jgi:hypothetical protein